MKIEMEPSGNHREKAEKELQPGSRGREQSPEEPEETEVQQPLVKERVPAQTQGQPEGAEPLTLEVLGTMEGQEVTIRDPEAKAEGRLDDPLFKKAVIQKDLAGHVSVVIKGGEYHPHYSGHRRRVFFVDSEDDISRLQITRPEK